MQSLLLLCSSVLLLCARQALAGAPELDQDTFKELTGSGRNGMIKFFQPWCGHCTRMKPDWDKLADEVHSSVFIADINCSDEAELCEENGVQGYPTIKVYKDGSIDNYNGPRGFDELLEYVDESLASKCDVKTLAASCSEKAQKYAAKWQSKGKSLLDKEVQRLSGMMDKSMTKDLKSWLRERLNILKQYSMTA